MTTDRHMNFFIRAASFILTFAAIVALGFLSFAGFYLIYPSVMWACVSMALASVIEFTVIQQNINNALIKLLQPDHLKNLLAGRLLWDLSENKNFQEIGFIKDYKAQRDYVHRLEHLKGLNDEQTLRLEREKARLKRMVSQFQSFLFNPDSERSSNFLEDFNRLLTKSQRQEFLKDYDRRFGLSYSVIIPVMIAAISCGFVTYTTIGQSLVELIPAIQAIIPSLSFSVGALTPGIVVFAVVAGAAYFFQILNATYDIIYDDSLVKLKNDVVAKVQEGTWASVGYGILVTCLVGLGVFVTLATAGTWWEAVKPAISVMARTETPAKILNIVSIFFYGCANLAFNLQNTQETLQEFKHFSITKTFKKLRKKIATAVANENHWQVFNPFRFLLVILRVPFRVISFFGHVFSIGVTTDNFGSSTTSHVISAGAASVTETFEDWHYIMGSDDHHHGPHEDGRGHNHDVDILGGIYIVITFVPLILPAVGWEWLASKRHSDEGLRLSLAQAWHKTWGTQSVATFPEAPDLSENWYSEDFNIKLGYFYGKTSLESSDVMPGNPPEFPSKSAGHNLGFFGNSSAGGNTPSDDCSTKAYPTLVK